VALLVRVIARHADLPRQAVHVCCAADGLDLPLLDVFHLVHPKEMAPLFVPAPLICAGLKIARPLLHLLPLPRTLLDPIRVTQVWMLEEHCDRPLWVDCAETRETLSWVPRPVADALRRMLDTQKLEAREWERRNACRIANLNRSVS
jgi:hypothetical protein